MGGWSVEERKSNKELEGALLVDETDDFEDDESGSEGFAGDGKAEQAMEVLVSLLEHMDLDAEVNVREDAERIVLNLEGPDAGRAIGKKGQTLDAIQFFVNKVVNRFPENRRHVVVDSGDYRERHDNGLIAMARREAKRALDRGRTITLEPMSARDRRVIHLSLAKFSGVTTRSDGQGADRRIQIIPSRAVRSGRPVSNESGNTYARKNPHDE